MYYLKYHTVRWVLTGYVTMARIARNIGSNENDDSVGGVLQAKPAGYGAVHCVLNVRWNHFTLQTYTDSFFKHQILTDLNHWISPVLKAILLLASQAHSRSFFTVRYPRWGRYVHRTFKGPNRKLAKLLDEKTQLNFYCIQTLLS